MWSGPGGRAGALPPSLKLPNNSEVKIAPCPVLGTSVPHWELKMGEPSILVLSSEFTDLQSKRNPSPLCHACAQVLG